MWRKKRSPKPDEDLHMSSGIYKPALYSRERVYIYAIPNLHLKLGRVVAFLGYD